MYLSLLTTENLMVIQISMDCEYVFAIDAFVFRTSGDLERKKSKLK